MTDDLMQRRLADAGTAWRRTEPGDVTVDWHSVTAGTNHRHVLLAAAAAVLVVGLVAAGLATGVVRSDRRTPISGASRSANGGAPTGLAGTTPAPGRAARASWQLVAARGVGVKGLFVSGSATLRIDRNGALTMSGCSTLTADLAVTAGAWTISHAVDRCIDPGSELASEVRHTVLSDGIVHASVEGPSLVLTRAGAGTLVFARAHTVYAPSRLHGTWQVTATTRTSADAVVPQRLSGVTARFDGDTVTVARGQWKYSAATVVNPAVLQISGFSSSDSFGAPGRPSRAFLRAWAQLRRILTGTSLWRLQGRTLVIIKANGDRISMRRI